MDDLKRELYLRNTEKYNEFHKDGQKEDRTTAEIIEIAAALEDGATIGCMTWLWPHMRLHVTLDNQSLSKIVDMTLEVCSADGYYWRLKRHNHESIQQRNGGPVRNGFDMSIADVAECFGLDDQKINNPDPVTPGVWTGWFLHSYGGPMPDDLLGAKKQ